MWKNREILATSGSTPNFSKVCSQCSSGLIKYIEFIEFPSAALTFTVAANGLPGTGNYQAHYFTDTPPSVPPFPTRMWIANIPHYGGTFDFMPDYSTRFLALFQTNPSTSFFKAVCFKFDAQTRLIIPQSF